MKRLEGSILPTAHYDMTFRAPIHAMLADQSVKRESPHRFLVISEEPITIEINSRTEIVLTKGTRFISFTHDWEQELHTCHIDYSVREGA